MPRRGGRAPQLVRIVDGLRGQVPMRMALALRPDYGSVVPWVERVWTAAWCSPGRMPSTSARRSSSASSATRPPQRSPPRGRASALVLSWYPSVLTSLIALKAMTDETTWAVVAAPTTSLPEDLRGVRNWDYRYCWLRDPVLTLSAHGRRAGRAGTTRNQSRWPGWSPIPPSACRTLRPRCARRALEAGPPGDPR
jgi:hypothetical protein